MKYRFSLIILMSLIFGCTKPADSGSPGPEEKESTDPSKYLLDEITFEHPTNPAGEKISFIYNTDNLLSEINWGHWVNYVQQNGAPDFVFETVNFKYTYQNGVPVLCEERDPMHAINHYYRYNDGKLVSRSTYNQDPTYIDRDSMVYRYTTDGRPFEATYYRNGRVYSQTRLTHSPTEVTQTYETNDYQAPMKSKGTYTGFDNKPSFMKAVPGFPKTFSTLEVWRIPKDEALLDFNYTIHKGYAAVTPGQDFPTTATTTRTYLLEYNVAGLPILKKDRDWTMKFKYKAKP